tara:strand:- start:6304 stop:7680 length:1377 start_codon:yes stop_codon:yes gene_type:complete
MNFKNSSYFIIGTASKYALNFLSIIVFARLFLPEDFGYWIKLLSIFSIIQFLIEFGQVNILISKKNKKFDLFFSELITWNIYLILIAYIFFLPMTIFILGFNNYSVYIYLFLFISIPFNILGNLLFVRIQYLKKFILVNYTPFLILLLGFSAALIYVYYFRLNIEALAFKIFIESLLTLSFSLFYTGSYFFNNFPKIFKIKNILKIENISIAIGDLAIKLSNHIDKIILSIILSPSMLGFYSRAYSLGLIGVAIGGYSITPLGIQSDNSKYKTLFLLLYNIFLSVIAFHLIYYHSEYFLLKLLGNNWKDLVALGWIISLMPAMKLFENFLYILCTDHNKTKIFPTAYFLSYSVSFFISLLIYSMNFNIYYLIFLFFSICLVIYLLFILFFLKNILAFKLKMYFSIFFSLILYLIYINFFMEYLINLALSYYFIIIIDLIICTIFLSPLTILLFKNIKK